MWGQVNRRFTTTDKTQCTLTISFSNSQISIIERIPIAWAVGPNMNRNNQTKRQR